jgi:hypothetical protein
MSGVPLATRTAAEARRPASCSASGDARVEWTSSSRPAKGRAPHGSGVELPGGLMKMLSDTQTDPHRLQSCALALVPLPPRCRPWTPLSVSTSVKQESQCTSLSLVQNRMLSPNDSLHPLTCCTLLEPLKHSQPSRSVGSTPMDSTNQRSQRLRENCVSTKHVQTVASCHHFLHGYLFMWYLHAIIGNPAMVQSTWEQVCRFHANATLFDVSDLIVFRLCALNKRAEQVLPGSEGHGGRVG